MTLEDLGKAGPSIEAAIKKWGWWYLHFLKWKKSKGSL
jgi:hypothetical protein